MFTRGRRRAVLPGFVRQRRLTMRLRQISAKKRNHHNGDAKHRQTPQEAGGRALLFMAGVRMLLFQSPAKLVDLGAQSFFNIFAAIFAHWSGFRHPKIPLS